MAQQLQNPSTVFQQLQHKMLSELEMTSTNIKHSGTQGAATEENWLKLFQDYLPTRYRAERGQVMDSKGGMSDQIDVIIFDRHFTPFLFNHKGVYFVPAESVYAVVEVKPVLNKAYIGYAGDKVASVRKLHRTSVPIPHAGGVYPAKALFPILGGIVAKSTEWQKGLGTAFKSALTPTKPETAINFGCALDKGAFEVDHSTATPKVSISDQNVLLAFIMSLLDRLQALASVPAIDYKAYGKQGN